MINSSRKALAVCPLLVVKDLRRAADYYMNVLGYQEPLFAGEPPTFCMMNRDGQDLMLCTERPFNVYLRVADIDEERKAIEAAGGKLIAGPRTTEYGMIEIDVEDPDGHVICLGQDLEPRGGG